MPRFCWFVVLLCWAQMAAGQNLVPNPSFEEHTQKPDSLDQWAYCKDWFSTKKRNPDHNPDYYHRYGQGDAKPGSIPYAYCYPDVDGDAMVGITSIDHRIDGAFRKPRYEYLYCKLKEPLIPGATYEASYWVSRGDADIQAGLWDYGLGMEFMVQKPVQKAFSHFPTEFSYPQVSHAYLGTSTQEPDIGQWKHIRVRYTAIAPFQYAVIGSFHWADASSCKEDCYAYSFIDDVSVVMVEGPTVEIAAADTICKGDSITLKGIKTHKYEWARLSDPSTIISQSSTLTLAPEQSTAYLLYGSFGVDTHFVEVVDVTDSFRLFPDTVACYDTKGLELGADAVAGAKYLWSPGGETTSRIVARTPGSYELRVALKGCELTSGTFELVDLTSGLSLPDSVYLCEDSFVVLENESLLDPDASRFWWPSGASTETLQARRSGTYVLTLRRGDCAAFDTTEVLSTPPLSVQLGDDYSLCEKNKESLRLNAGKGFESYRWFPTGDSSHFITVQKVGAYYVVVADAYGCKADDETVIRSECPYPMTLFFPNAFSPNGDLVNDAFEVKGEHVASYTLKVFNRWGQCLYTSTALSEAWDGSFKGIICQDDAYFYTCSVMGPDEKGKNRMRMFSGYIHLKK